MPKAGFGSSSVARRHTSRPAGIDLLD